MTLTKPTLFLTVIMCLAAPGYTIAQTPAEERSDADDDANALTEVTVTARRVNESQQTSPIAITALGGDMLEQLATWDTIDLSGRAPNVQVIQTGAGSGAASVFIRGIGNNALGFNLANPVGVYVDDVYISRLQGSLVDLLDLERVEILRGPQGTLYGRDSTVGAVKYVSKLPDLYDSHFIGKTVIGDYDRRDVLMGASIPIIPGELAVKLDVSSRDQTGYMIGVDVDGNDDGQRGNGIDRQSGRVSVLWTPNDRWDLNFTADFSNDDSGSTIPTRIYSVNGGTCDPSVAACEPAFGSVYKTGINTTPAGYAHSKGTALHAEYDMGSVSLKSITAYRELDALDVIDRRT